MPSLLHNPTLFEQILRMAIADYRFRHCDESKVPYRKWLSNKLPCDDNYPGQWIRRKSPFKEHWFIKIVELLAGSQGLKTESDIYIFAKAAGKDHVGLLKGVWWENILAKVRTNGTLDERYWAMSRELQLRLDACGALPHLKSYEFFVFIDLWGVSEEAALASLSELSVLGWVSKQGEVWHIQPHVLKYAQKLFEELPRREKTRLRDWAKCALRSEIYRQRRLKLHARSHLFASWQNRLDWRKYPTYILQRLLHPEEVSDLHTRGQHDRNFSQLDTLEFLYVWESHLRDICLNKVMRLAIIFGILTWLLESLLPMMNFLSLLCAVVTAGAAIVFFFDGLRYIFQDLPRYEIFFPRK